MQVILLSDVKKVGRKFEIVNVSDGYAHNVLLPQQKAALASPENIKKYTAKVVQSENKKVHEEEVLQESIKTIGGKTLTISVSASENGTLFKALHKKDISEEIKKQFQIDIPETVIDIEDIKKVGEYTVLFSISKQKLTLFISAS